MIDQDHHLRNTNVEAEVLNRLGYFENSLMKKTQGILVGFFAIVALILSQAFPVNFSKKAMDAFNPFFAPRLDCLQGGRGTFRRGGASRLHRHQ